ncbi:hypothetical protein JOE58_000768 [Curtobacterium luteum]|uniref:Uncharacterized protein n=1 Tax=Curtobacterium luteum TaxID=33881 RepID=A0A8H9G604_9MICO|nr:MULTISPECIES: hypothetical protein [Curtobacterium]MBM7801517.1 hypothetical protein [Curtobacterium luteum]NUU52155.1 hypothetical protein [Curtobacterium luteum]GGK89867.1 hypothetical protein GCM10009769_04890 [Curtobacterium luteum]
MIGRRYLLDNNVLPRLTVEQRRSDFVVENCRVPSEVLHEARFLPDIEKLLSLEYPTTGRVLRHLMVVMSRVPIGDTALVDLYKNRGNADPLLVACALDGLEEANEGLFGIEWVVVSDDGAVQGMCEEFRIVTLTSVDFLRFLTRG